MDINGSARTYRRVSKAMQTESIEALIHAFSKIIRQGTNYYCDHMTNVTHKIQCKYLDLDFSKVFYGTSKQKVPMAKILSELKKGNTGS